MNLAVRLFTAQFRFRLTSWILEIGIACLKKYQQKSVHKQEKEN
jgi:hypothetical protein